MMKIKVIFVSLLSLVLCGCGLEWSDSDKFITKLECGASIEATKAIVESEGLSFEQTNLSGIDIAVVSKRGDHIWVFFSDKDRLVSIMKPEWAISFFGIVAGGTTAQVAVKSCPNKNVNGT